ncbi:hypothetical protein DL93DRAFT_2166561 [Clavulina sp. PMI_390]|nr:hypothetical protein DL93DRAFT_2166561 [Clavulina sp. PMI_390]
MTSPSLPTVGPSPPRRVTFALKNLRDVPQRFLNPPDVSHVPRGRSYRVKPHFKVTLDDILSNKHLPPLSATDFENFLTYAEYEKGSVQNLYFLMWLREYTREYKNWKTVVAESIQSSATTTPLGSEATSSTKRTKSAQPYETIHPPAPLPAPRHPTAPTPLETAISRPSIPETVKNAAVSIPMTQVTSTVSSRPRIYARAPPSKTLAYSWYRARRTFFLPIVAEGGPLSTTTNPVTENHLQLRLHRELLRPFIGDDSGAAQPPNHDEFPPELIENLNDEILYGKRRDTYAVPTDNARERESRGLAYPAPERFDLVRKEVQMNLEESLKHFIEVSFANTGNFRGLFGSLLSLSWLITALVIYLAVGVWGQSYYLFILGTLFTWMGTWGVLITLNGVCICVFLFGSRQWFVYETDSCGIPRPGDPPRRTLSTPTPHPSHFDGDEQGILRGWEVEKKGREEQEENERRLGLADAEARFAAGGDADQAQARVSEDSDIETERLDEVGSPTELDGRGAAMSSSDADSSFVVSHLPSHPSNDRGIFISESYSEGFSPPNSPIQVSLSAGSSGAGSRPTSVGPPRPPLTTTGAPHHAGDAIDPNSVITSFNLEGPEFKSPRSIPLGGESALSEYERTDATPWPPGLDSVSVTTKPRHASSPTTEGNRAFSPPQLIPHDHQHLRSAQTNHHHGPLVLTSSNITDVIGGATPPVVEQRRRRLGRLAKPASVGYRHHEHRPRPSSPPKTPPILEADAHIGGGGLGAGLETDEHGWPKFDFDRLPKQPPPQHLCGDRREISFAAPMMSIQQCPLVVRMHWSVRMHVPPIRSAPLTNPFLTCTIRSPSLPNPSK